MNRFSSMPPVVQALFVQLVVYAVLSVIAPRLHLYLGFALPLFWLMVLQGTLSSSISYLLRFSYWWVAIQFAAPPLLVLGLALNVPVWVFPILLLFLMMIFWNVAINRVPLYLTNSATAAKLDGVLPKTAGLKIVDLGSGLGGTMRYLAGIRKDQLFYGYETAPMPFLLSWILARSRGVRNLHFRFKSFWGADLSEFDVVYCFLSPVPMPDLYEKAVAEMKPGSLFISNSFVVPGRKPDRTVTVKDSRKTKLLIWKI